MSTQCPSEPAVAQSVFHKIAENLYRLESSGGYYALLKRGGKQFRRSLKTRYRKSEDRRLCANCGPRWADCLPPALLVKEHNPEFYAEWLDSYFAHDVQQLFRLEKRAGFLRVLELLMRQWAGMLKVTKLAAESQISRPTVTNWLEVYQITHAAHLVRPYSTSGRREIVAQPKVFGFDTGLVCHARGWDHLRTEDCGLLWEHLVLDTVIAASVPKIQF